MKEYNEDYLLAKTNWNSHNETARRQFLINSGACEGVAVDQSKMTWKELPKGVQKLVIQLYRNKK